MWSHLKKYIIKKEMKVRSRRFQLEFEIGEYTKGNKSIQHYSGFMALLIEYSYLVYYTVPDTSLLTIQKIHETAQRHQFLMRLRKEYELVCTSLMNRVPSSTQDAYLQELIREE